MDQSGKLDTRLRIRLLQCDAWRCSLVRLEDSSHRIGTCLHLPFLRSFQGLGLNHVTRHHVKLFFFALDEARIVAYVMFDTYDSPCPFKRQLRFDQFKSLQDPFHHVVCPLLV